jgi:hypothetical protein
MLGLTKYITNGRVTNIIDKIARVMHFYIIEHSRKCKE